MDDTLIVGTGECPTKTVFALFYSTEAPQYAKQLDPILQKNCLVFVEGLNVSADIGRYKKILFQNKLSPEEVIRGVLDIWVKRMGNNAKLSKLLEVIEVQCGATDVGHCIRHYFSRPRKRQVRPNPSRPVQSRQGDNNCCCVCL